MASEETKMLFINATQAQEFKENKNDQNWALKELIGTLANILYENRSKNHPMQVGLLICWERWRLRDIAGIRKDTHMVG